MTHETTEPTNTISQVLKRSRNMALGLGIALILVGFAAIVFPFVSSLGVTFCIAWMLVFAAIAQSVNAFGQKDRSGMLLSLVVAALWLVGGIFLMMRPLEGLLALTVFVGVAFFMEGIVKTVFAFQLKPRSGWGWLLFDGVVAILVGAMLWWQLPFTAIWALGTLAGINIMISGWTLIMASDLWAGFSQPKS